MDRSHHSHGLDALHEVWWCGAIKDCDGEGGKAIREGTLVASRQVRSKQEVGMSRVYKNTACESLQ